MPTSMAYRCMDALSGVISARQAHLARCLSAFAVAESLAGACAVHCCTEPLSVALSCPVEPHRKPADQEAFFFTQDTAAEPEKLEAARAEHRRLRHFQLFERLGPEVKR